MEHNPIKQKNNPAEQQASTSTSPCLHYDIFLSFRGLDTRYTFIDHLKRELDRAGYLVFFDDEGIPFGKEIRSELPKAIEESKSSIVVLSQDYAASKWCLNELVTIMGRHSQDEQYYVLPVFYHIDPSHVRHQRKSFANSFAKHQEAFEEEIVNEWKESLAKIGGLKGILVEENTKESEVIQEIVKEIGECITGTAKYEFPTSELVGKGFKRARDEICSLLEKVDVEKIGVYGMGGVGKTTLMTHIYNQLQQRSDSFPKSYWVTVSQDFSIYKLQHEIAKAILDGKNSEDIAKEDDIKKRAAKLMGELIRKQKFILFLDDLWVHFDTKDAGLPVGPNGCKLVFTTRSDEVCRKMGCKKNKVRVERLSDKEAFDLFKKEIGDIEIDDEALVQSVVRECARLPLAIKVMAKSLQEVDDVGQWRYRFAQLRESKVTKGDDMEQQVFAVLRTSYASLKDQSLRECFLYCALYPEDAQIEREGLIEHLICEGIIEEGKSRQEEVDQGRYMLDKLVSLCLLEDCGEYKWGRSVKMHDLIRDVALQELRNRTESAVMVETGKQLRALPDVGKWSINLHRASFMHHDIINIPSGHSPYCPHLSTLLLGCDEFPNTSLGDWLLNYIGDSFFEKLNGLKVLDLSKTGIKELPGSISNLVRLTGLFLTDCEDLRHVPSLAKLQELKALDLYGTKLKEVPHGMAFLHNLRYVNMSCDDDLKVFPTGILPNLSRLQFLGLHNWMVKGEEVVGLSNLEVLLCGFQEGFAGFNSYLQFQKHEKPLVSFQLFVNCWKPNSFRYPTAKSVEVWRCDISRQFDKLPKGNEELVLDGCKCPRSLLVPISNATELKFIKIVNCDGIECLVSRSSSGSSVDVLNKLERLELFDVKSLWLLVEINTPHQVLPSYGTIFIHLKELEVCICHGMRTLFPLGLLQNLKNLKVLRIQGCEGMKEIIASEESGSNITSQFSLPKLSILWLFNLPRLTSICDGSLICQLLQEIEVFECPMLKRIPIAPPLPFFRQGIADSEELLEQFERDHPTAKDNGILRHVESRELFYREKFREQFEQEHPNNSSSVDELDSDSVLNFILDIISESVKL